MKITFRSSVVLGIFAGMMAFSSPNYAGTFPFEANLGINPKSAVEVFKGKLEFLRGPFLKKKKAAIDPYTQALRAARALAVSA